MKNSKLNIKRIFGSQKNNNHNNNVTIVLIMLIDFNCKNIGKKIAFNIGDKKMINKLITYKNHSNKYTLTTLGQARDYNKIILFNQMNMNTTKQQMILNYNIYTNSTNYNRIYTKLFLY